MRSPGQRRVPVERVAKETFIVREPGSGTRLAMQQFFEERAVRCKVGMEMASNETIKQAVMAGMGVSFISRHTIDLEIQTGRLVVLDVRGTPVDPPVARRALGEEAPVADRRRVQAVRADAGT